MSLHSVCKKELIMPGTGVKIDAGSRWYGISKATVLRPDIGENSSNYHPSHPRVGPLKHSSKVMDWSLTQTRRRVEAVILAYTYFDELKDGYVPLAVVLVRHDK
jgi:hypothetical protein